MADIAYRQYDPDVLRRLQAAELEVLKAFDEICRELDLRYFVHYGALIGALRHGGPIPWDDDIDVAMPRKDFSAFVAYCDEHPEMEWGYMDPTHHPECANIVPIFYRKGTVFAEDDIGWQPGISIDIFPFDHVADDAGKRAGEIRRATFLRRLLYLCYRDPLIPLEGWKYHVAKALCKIARWGIVLFRVKGADVFRSFESKNRQTDQRNAGSSQMTTFFDAAPLKSLLSADQFEGSDLPFAGTTIRGPKDPDGLLRTVYGDYMQLPPEGERVNHCPAHLDFGDGCGDVLS